MFKNLKIALSLSFLIVMASCQKSNQSDDLVVDDEVFESEEFVEHHTALNSLDYMGIYKGVLPCADCEGIQTTVELGSGNSYTKKVIYLGKDDQEVIETSGTFSWNEGGNTITLNEEEEPNQYFVGENILFHLDMEGNRIEGELAEKYQLNKE
ncbi:copper resistance protein NlpE [Belliella sp. R4-6]|uniref:Copper resistance protein NlpE n=1 Tax=Belliella alkalica TaxID=1730871 RepID=A0ABS9VHR0_9BACT|nr:copper resistance protein NlpE [Belliella alkalica]MCH7415403.1 copper resistance protein NlpE [Belliella alkalica]